MTTDWKQRHNDAIVTPNVREEPLVLIKRGVDRYIANAELFDSEGNWRDYVLGEGIADLLKGFRTLLNGDLGRLDGGTLDTWVCDTAARIGWDLDLDQWADESGPS